MTAMKYLRLCGGYSEVFHQLGVLPIVLPHIGPRTLLVHPTLVRLCGSLGVPVAPLPASPDDLEPALAHDRVSTFDDVLSAALYQEVGWPRPACIVRARPGHGHDPRLLVPLPDPVPPVPLWCDPEIPLPRERVGLRGIPRATLDPLGLDMVSLNEGGLRARGVTDWAGTAAVIRGLDLVITTDGAIAHLAGLLRVPTYVLLTPCPVGFWDPVTPLYPTVRVFHQYVPGDWAPVVAQVAEALQFTSLKQAAA